MKRIILISSLLLTFPLFADANSQTTLTAEAKTKIQAFAKQLKTTLKSGIKQGGPQQGIEVCKEAATGIAKLHSTDGWEIGRTSLKLRNSNNQPDQWELKQLKHFESEKAKGENPKKLVASEVVTDEKGQQYFRFIKAIPTGKLCLACHGTNIKPEIQTKIDQHYPEDNATGFKAGDIRGAFTLTKKL